MPLRAFLAVLAVVAGLPLPVHADTLPIEPPPPCHWWVCGGEAEVVVENYRVDTLIEDGVATTRVHQVVRNDSDFVGEGTFLHPIPFDAAVTGLTLWIDDQPVSGELLGGEAARRTYEDIVRRTLDPALLEWADDGLLRLSVFPIEPHETRTVEIEYRQVLPVDGGLSRFRHPLGTEHNAHIEQVSARVVIRSSSGVKNVWSPTPGVSISRPTDDSAVVGFESEGAPDGEFVLYHSTGESAIGLQVLSHRDGEDGYFLLLASPGLDRDTAVVSKDVIVVLDVSGSMEGEKLAQAQAAARYVLSNLNPGDRFDVIAFSTGVDSFGGALRPASEAIDARAWVSGLGSGGSTNIDLALSEAFVRASGSRPAYVLFLTDGLATEGVTDTGAILGRLDERRRDAISVFAFGVGHDVDTFLLDSIARDHHGTSSYVTPGEPIDAAVEALYAKVASPVLTGVSLDVDGVAVSDVHPWPIPDVFRGGQLILTGRYEGSGPATVHLSGRVAGEDVTFTYPDVPFREDAGDAAVPRLWASRKIGDLLRSVRIDGPNEETIEQIVRLSIRWGVITPYTSYLVTEPDPLGEAAIEEIARDATRSANATTAPVSGADAFEAADTAADLAAAESVGAPSDGAGDRVRLAGDRTFLLVDGIWIDTTFDPTMTEVALPFGSDAYFSLAQADGGVAAALSVGSEVVIVVDGVAYRITTQAPPSTGDTAASTSSATTIGETATATGLPVGDPTDSGFPIAVVVIGAALGTALILAWTSLRRSS